jgi:thymidylate kinase
MADAENLAPLIAVVGADGSGKSRLSADLLTHIRQNRPAAAGYLGEGSSVTSRQIGRWPLIGSWLKGRLEGVADRLRDPGAPIPGLVAANYALHRSKKRLRRFEELIEKRRSGVIIVTDRYPQIETPGLHDGPILAGLATNPLLARVKAEEHAIYARMAAYAPTLVIRLHVEVDIAMARKPDHDRALIARKVESLAALTFNGAPILDLDATMDYTDELSKAKAAVEAALATSSTAGRAAPIRASN